jgi:hypothetical protein
MSQSVTASVAIVRAHSIARQLLFAGPGPWSRRLGLGPAGAGLGAGLRKTSGDRAAANQAARPPGVSARSCEPGGSLPLTLLVVGSVASPAANVAVAQPTATGRVIAAWPSFTLIAAYELLMRYVRRSAATGGKAPLRTPQISREEGRDGNVQRPRAGVGGRVRPGFRGPGACRSNSLSLESISAAVRCVGGPRSCSGSWCDSGRSAILTFRVG